MPTTKKLEEKEELWKLVVRHEKKVIADNLSYEEGCLKLLLYTIPKVLVPISYKFTYKQATGWTWC